MNRTVTVRAATAHDAGAIAQVHVTAWRSAYAGIVPDAVLARLDVSRRADQWHTRLERGARDVVLVAEADGEVCGFVSARTRRDAEDASSGAAGTEGEVEAIYVDPRRWRRGVGRALLEAAAGRLALAGCSAATLWVLVDNGRARRFYERFGWVTDGTVQDLDFAGTAVPEIRYRRELGGLLPAAIM